MTRGFATAVVLGAATLIGCDRGGSDSPPGGSDAAPTASASPTGTRSGASTTPSTTQATTQAAAESLINIDGNLVLFPAARLRIDEADDKVVARLFSDDPKGAALDENYEGNSFYLQVELDPDDAKDLNGVVLTYRATTSERDDSPYGIFLEGRRWVLQPDVVKVSFEGTGSPLDVQVSGTFLMFDTNDETAKPKRAQVAAKLVAAVQPRK